MRKQLRRNARLETPRCAGIDGSHADALLVLAIYSVMVGAHIVAFYRVYEFPYLCTDAVQYVTTAANVLRGQGYTIRGSLNSTCPPLYPLFLTLAFSLGLNPRASAFVLSCLAVSLIVIPAYSFARLLRLDRLTATCLALTAGLLPHTLYCSFYMSESLYLPVFVWAGYYAYRWFSKPTVRLSLVVGGLISALLLIKIAALVVVGAFAGVAIARLCFDLRTDSVRRHSLLLSTGTVLGTIASTQVVWYAFKTLHHGNALGTYGTVLHDVGLPRLSASLVGAYIADYFLAPGLLIIVPTIYFLVCRWRSDRWIVMYFVVLFAIQVIWVSVVDGGITGMLRERLLSFSFPITAIFATKGFVELRHAGDRAWKVMAFLGVPLALTAILSLYDFHEPSVVEFPLWYALGAIGGPHLGPFASSRMLINVLAVLLSAGVGIWVFGSGTRARGFVVIPLGLQLFAFCVAAVLLANATAKSLGIIAPMKDWLASQGASYDARVLVASPPAYFEMRSRAQHRSFPECMPATALDPVPIWQFETYYRWDVRSVCSSEEVQAVGRPGDLLLTAHSVSGAVYLSALGQYRLYRLSGGPVRSVAPRTKLTGYVDYPRAGSVLKKEARIGGWALAGDSAIADVYVYVDGTLQGMAAIGGRRPDVAKAFPSEPSAMLSGFYTILDISDLTAGPHVFSIKARTVGGELLHVGSDVSVTVYK